MNQFQDFLTNINVKDLIKIFNIQIAIAVILIFFIFRGILSQIVLTVFFKLTKNKQKIKETRIYKVLSNLFIALGVYIAIVLLKPSAQVLAIVNVIYKIIIIFFITNIINSFITKDSKIFKKYLGKSKNDTVNGFICNVIKAFVWVVSIYIMLKELGYDLTGLIAGFGIRQCYNITCSTRYSKKFA